MLTGVHAFTSYANTRQHSTTMFTKTIKWIVQQHGKCGRSSGQFSSRPFYAATVGNAATSTTLCDPQLLQDMLYRIRQVSHVPPDIRDSLLEFRVDGIKLGQVRPNIAKLLCSFKLMIHQTDQMVQRLQLNGMITADRI